MALLKTIVTDQGEVNQAYARIDTLSGYKGGFTFTLNYYVNQEAFTQDKGYVKQTFYDFVPSLEDGAPNFIKQGYEYLKTIAEFSTAIDA